MRWKFLKPNSWNVTVTVILSLIYYFATFSRMILKCAGSCSGSPAYKSYAFWWGHCGSTCSQVESIISLIIFIVFIPVVYMLVSYIVSLFRKN